jgi:hypothetical protein
VEAAESATVEEAELAPSLAFASPPPLALNLDSLQEFLDRTRSRIMIGEMLTFSGETAGSGP